MSKYKKLAKQEAKTYLAERKRAKTKEEKKEFKAKWKERKAQWKSGLSALDKKEKKAQKKGFKAFERRKNRVRRVLIWALVLALVVSLAYPMLSMTFGVLGSQKYTDTGAAAEAVKAAGTALSTEICQEGFVLMKNDDGLLPLDGVKLNIFGDDAYNFVYGGSGSAGADQSGAASIFKAFSERGIEYNKDLDAAYTAMRSGSGGADTSIMHSVMSFFGMGGDSGDWAMPSDEVFAQAKSYSDTALIVLSSMEVEGAEIELALLQPCGDAMPGRKALIDRVCSEFEHVIFIINSGNVMELGFVNEYPSADAVLWVGSPGSQGCYTIADVLKGDVNPSGKTVDTWVASIESEPSYQTYGSYNYDNLSMYTMEYSEGIYVGYRYYETRFGEDEAAYAENVVFPFGHGLSYTEFEQKITGFKSDDDTVTAEVTVKNIGSVPGKDVVELYFMAPYYESSGIEKSAIELAAYAKTSELQPGKNEKVTLSFDVRDMSSWKDGAYILEKGEYKIAVGRNVHDALLTKDFETYTVDKDITYTTDETTGATLASRFGFAEGDVKYLSRSDWEGTFPVKPEGYTASAELLAAKAEYEKFETAYTAEPTYGANNGIKLSELKGLDYADPKWDAFLDQFTVDEMIKLCANGGWHTVAVDRLGVPQSHLLDGPSGMNSMYSPLNAVAYPMETIISSSWNIDMANRLGATIGDEAAVYGVNGWYAPAMNIHRSSVGGRNNEYFSEDPYLSGTMAVAAVQGAQEKGLFAFIKHLVCNDLELNARSGIYIWVNEQSLREMYLRPFEMAVKDGGALGAMSSFSHLGYKWCGACPELLQDVLRTEWGFNGTVTTDACLGGWMNAEGAVKFGNDLMLEMGLQQSQTKLEKAYKADPAGVGNGLRNSVHDICYSLVNGTLLF